MRGGRPMASDKGGPREVGFRQEIGAVRSLFPYLWPHDRADLRFRVVLAMALLIGGKGIAVTVPMIYKLAVDRLTPGYAAGALLVVPAMLIVAYGVARVGAQLFAELREGVFAKVEQHAVREVGLRTFRHLHSLSLRYHLERQTGGLSRAIERGIRGTEFLLSYLLFALFPTLIEIAMVAAILWRLYSISFALVTLGVIAVYVVFTFLVTDWRIKFRREMNERDSEASTKAVDSLLNFETVKYFANEEHEARRFDKALAAYERAAVKSQTTLSAMNIGQGIIIATGLVGVMILAARGIVAGTMTVGDFVLVNSYLVQLYAPLNQLGMVYRNIKQSLTDLESMFRLLRVDPDIADKENAPALVVTKGEIVFDHVSFAYDQRREILHDVSFRVAPGQTVAIVGPSGAGKSTISRLLFRFYDVDDGAIRIDGQDLRDVTQDSLRRSIGVVPQDTVLFNDTIRYNIGYGRPGAEAGEIAEAARRARLDQFIARLPDGDMSPVGERGLKLSGGEKQRVAIARVILKNPRILVFDEATSALDTKTEREIQQSLDEVAGGRSTLMIAHRLSTVVGAHEILVLDQGRIVERGDHLTLLAKGGVYAQMWQRQQETGEDAELVTPAE